MMGLNVITKMDMVLSFLKIIKIYFDVIDRKTIA